MHPSKIAFIHNSFSIELLSDVSINTPALLRCLFATFLFLSLLIFSLSGSLYLKCNSHIQHTIGTNIFIHSNNFHLILGLVSLLPFSRIMDLVKFRLLSHIFALLLYSVFLFSVYYPYDY